MELALFLVQVFVISFSGAMAPGPVTATCIQLGSRNRYAGGLVAVGHGVIEFPLMILIMLGMDKIFKLEAVRMAISFVGGGLLLFMAVMMFIESREESQTEKYVNAKPVLAGVVLSASNPYFLLWWATVGLGLALQAKEFAVWAFGIFAVVHWSCDLVWFQMLSWMSFKGSQLLGSRSQRIILLVCAAAMLFFGLKFIVYDGLLKLTG